MIPNKFIEISEAREQAREAKAERAEERRQAREERIERKQEQADLKREAREAKAERNREKKFEKEMKSLSKQEKAEERRRNKEEKSRFPDFPDERTCEICGNPLRTRRKYCSECRPYGSKFPIYNTRTKERFMLPSQMLKESEKFKEKMKPFFEALEKERYENSVKGIREKRERMRKEAEEDTKKIESSYEHPTAEELLGIITKEIKKKK